MTNSKRRIESPKANTWFQSGKKLRYSIKDQQILHETSDVKADENTIMVWNKTVNDKGDRTKRLWTTMMPGFPDGSFGWAGTEHILQGNDHDPRLYIEYVGMGGSDKPSKYPYGVIERANLIETIWEYYGVRETTLVTFDFSSLVALELLSRQIDKQQGGLPISTTIRKVLFINGGLFADSHSHPVLTTPLLKTSFGRIGTVFAQRYKFAFNLMMKDLWSPEYSITKEELAEFHTAISQKNGALFMSWAAGFVDEHQLNAERWDLKRVFLETCEDIQYIVAGSEKDQFEPRQVIKASKVLKQHGLHIIMFPGGHMTTSEHPELIVEAIHTLKDMRQT